MATLASENSTARAMLATLKEELASIEPQYLALTEAISGLEKWIRVSENHQFDNLPTVSIGQPMGFPLGAFDGLTTKEAVVKCLYLIGSPAQPKDIVNLILKSGYQHTSKNFSNALYTALDRLAKNEKWIDKVDDGWQINDAGKEAFKELKEKAQSQRERLF